MQAPALPLAAGAATHPFDRAPFIVIWEATRACALACQHCRAEAVTARDPLELSTAEARALMAHIAADFGPVLFVITGGDPLERPDLCELIAHGRSLGLRMAVTPSATTRLTPAAIAAMREAGVQRLAISLDGADAATHDAFRGIPGTFARSIGALAEARRLGLETQVNSSIWRGNRHQLRAIADVAAWQGAKLWSVFLLVPTGRAERDQLLSPAEHERVYRELADIALAECAPFDVKTTAGQPFYRVLAQRGAARRTSVRGMRAPRAINDGNGFIFVAHDGTISPSGFMPIALGNVREQRLADVYREHPLLRDLRDPSRYAGKCGHCPFNDRCGGSRSRSWALTGDPLASDPTCVYVPPAA